MDIATILGIVLAFGLITGAIFTGAGVNAFVDIPSVMIVVGGTIGVSLINFPLKELLGVSKVVKNAFFSKTPAIEVTLNRIVEFSSRARKEGILALQNEIKEIGDPFLSRGLQLAIDGLEPQSIEVIMNTELQSLGERHQLGADLFATMGAVSPAMGLIGTLIGLIQMLQNLSDPSAIGPGMAVALLTTFYGALLANVLFNPISGKLRTRSQQEILFKELVREGIISIIQGDNPRIVEQKLHGFLAPKLRVSQFK